MNLADKLSTLREADREGSSLTDTRGKRQGRFGEPVLSGISASRQEQNRLRRKAEWEAKNG